jgi:hypothetical protein
MRAIAPSVASTQSAALAQTSIHSLPENPHNLKPKKVSVLPGKNYDLPVLNDIYTALARSGRPVSKARIYRTALILAKDVPLASFFGIYDSIKEETGE